MQWSPAQRKLVYIWAIEESWTYAARNNRQKTTFSFQNDSVHAIFAKFRSWAWTGTRFTARCFPRNPAARRPVSSLWYLFPVLLSVPLLNRLLSPQNSQIFELYSSVFRCMFLPPRRSGKTVVSLARSSALPHLLTSLMFCYQLKSNCVKCLIDLLKLLMIPTLSGSAPGNMTVQMQWTPRQFQNSLSQKNKNHSSQRYFRTDPRSHTCTCLNLRFLSLISCKNILSTIFPCLLFSTHETQPSQKSPWQLRFFPLLPTLLRSFCE